MTLWDAIVLGIVQGLTEFLPISSTAHLVIVRQLMGHEHPEDAFTTVIQLGTLVAVILYSATTSWHCSRPCCTILSPFSRRFHRLPPGMAHYIRHPSPW